MRVGIFGGGVVGGGVYELIQRCRSNGKLVQLGVSIEVVKICVRTLDKVYFVPSLFAFLWSRLSR